MYDGAITSVRKSVGMSSEFPITICLHQESTLSPNLFALVMNQLTKLIPDDIVLVK